MKSLISKELYEVSFKKLLKKAVIISVVFHLLIFVPAYVKSKTEKKRTYYAPVYSVNLVGKLKARKKSKKKARVKVAQKKKKKKKTPKKKKAPKKKAVKKIKTPNGLKYAEKVHVDKKGKPVVKEKENEKTLQDTLAKIKEEVEEREKLEATLKKLSEQIKEREEKEEPEEVVKEAPKKAAPDERLAAGYGGLSREMMNITEKKYYNMIWKRIKDAWILPSDISKKNRDLVTIIVIRIEKDGRVSDIKIEESSGISYYDQSAIRAIKKAEPFEKFIDGMNRDFFKVGVRFRPTEQ